MTKILFPIVIKSQGLDVFPSVIFVVYLDLNSASLLQVLPCKIILSFFKILVIEPYEQGITALLFKM